MMRMRRLIVLAGVAALFAALPTWADDPMTLTKKYACIACHAQDQKVVGPAFKDVAKKYRGQSGADTKLMAKARTGGVGVWGTVPMPPNPTPSDADLKELVEYILTLK